MDLFFSHFTIDSQLEGLETDANVFMTSSCLAPLVLSLRPAVKKTSFAASASGLWCILRADGQVSSYLHPVSTAATPHAAQRGNDFTGYCSDKELLVFGLQRCFSSGVSHYVQRFLLLQLELFSLFIVAHSDWNSKSTLKSWTSERVTDDTR